MAEPAEIALIFDLDNTLIHSTIDFLGTRHRLIDLLLDAGAAPASRDVLLREPIPLLVAMGEAAGERIGRAMWEIVAAAEAEGLRQAVAVEHAAEVLAELRARGYRLAVLTNNARPGVAPKLAELGLDRYFEVIATRTEVPALKPSPEGIHYILDRLPGVRLCYMIGDAWIDGQAARAAGARFIGFGPRREAARERGVTPWAWIDDLRELLTLPLTRDA
ncbi:MAG: HAD-IA family hydrolase [Armatimonadota bacterium]|nr:HAD-IA family hydrolase [Armatimonadota bacterium]MDR7451898.1 HAD-IA family hydrolase [Armatimonadota bacterium]MDR7466580.1 HAD-IA family hydrolase [Armatimonadota bacterium]MDR7495098.1 HAD-IA family hydrolase [Armatimonadota bacterium]MDR7500172.1 HAD-IA family hydrolase [Armatimonadota bacterium]